MVIEAYKYTQSPEFKEKVNEKWLEIKETTNLGIDYTKFYLIAVKEFLLNNTELTEKDIIIENPNTTFEDNILFYGEHTKNKRKSTEEKHQNANARRQRDQGGEKKKQKKNWESRGGKRK